jgi:hypothetical protein
MAMTDQTAERSQVRWRSIALPVEHGGWGFTFEPIILGLLVAGSPSAWEIGVAAVAVFLARRPFKLAATDLVRRRWLPRSTIAAGFAAAYGLIALAGIVGATVTAAASFWQPLVLATPLAAIAIYADAHSRSRTVVAEMAGSIAMGATVTMIVLADGWELAPAFGLWLVLAARAVTTVALVRGQIRRVHERPTGERSILAIQVAAVVVMVVAAIAAVVPWMSVVAIAAIGVLAYVSLRRPPVAARTVGWTQIVVGLGVVVLTAIGVWLPW